MSYARVIAVADSSPAALAGVCVGDELLTVSGEVLRDVIQYRILTDEAEVSLDVRRGGLEFALDVFKAAGEPLGIELDTPVYDQVRTCDNHCEFCFIYQLPPGMRRSLYLKDDDYRLSFLYGNFTTLTRFTEADLERVITEGLSPLYVSIHATDPHVRAELLRNKRGGVSLRWLRMLLDHGVTVHGQVVVCPGVNDGAVLEDTLCGVLDEYPELANVAIVPLGVSAYNTETRMRPHTVAEARAVLDCVESWQETFQQCVGHRMAYPADEYYLLAEREFPDAAVYGDAPMHEDGIGMAVTFATEFRAGAGSVGGVRPGFFAWADGASTATASISPNPTGYQVTSRVSCGTGVLRATEKRVSLRPRPSAPVAILTGSYGAAVLRPLLAEVGRADVRVLSVENRFFGGNIGVTGLMVGADLRRVLADQPAGHRYLLPDVCLSGDRFLDGMTLSDLPHPVEVVPTDGAALRAALGS